MKTVSSDMPRLKHLPFFSALDEAKSPATYTAIQAGLLALRLVDHWAIDGTIIVEPDSVGIQSLRTAIAGLEPTDRLRECLIGIVNTMQSLQSVDIQLVLPRLFAYAMFLEKRGDLVLAADVYDSVSRLGHESYDVELVVESLIRAGYCRRTLGAFDESERIYDRATRIARRRKVHGLALQAQIGRATVIMTRGDLPAADTVLRDAAAEAQTRGLTDEFARAQHGRFVIASRRGNLSQAACLAYESLEAQSVDSERDRVLGDLGAVLILMKRYEAALDALTILDATAVSETVRWNARVNLVALGARALNRDLFTRARASLEGVMLPPETLANYLIESARGYRSFGEPEVAETLLVQALELANLHGLHRSVFEIEEMFTAMTSGELPVPEPSVNHPDSDALEEVVAGLRLAAAAIPA